MTTYAAAEIQEILIRNLYAGRVVRFNNIAIDNLNHEKRADTEVDFRTPVRDWLRTQFHQNIKMKDVWIKYREVYIFECYYTLLFYIKLFTIGNTAPMTTKKRLRKLKDTSIYLDDNLS